MKRLNLQVSIETFAFFDVILVLLSILGFGLLIFGRLASINWLFYLMLVCEAILIYSVLLAPRRITIKKYREALTKNPKHWVRAVFLSDLHAGKNNDRAWFEKVADKANELHPHILFLGGDFVLWKKEDALRIEPISNIKARAKYFVLGNHDYLDNPESIAGLLKSWGLTNITNSGLSFRSEGAELKIFGMDDTMFGRTLIPEHAQLIIAHSPDAVFDLKEGSGLVVCGHTHGGQIRLPIFGCFAIPSKLGCKVDQGVKIINGVRMIISRGLGEVAIRARLLCPPEITYIELGID